MPVDKHGSVIVLPHPLRPHQIFCPQTHPRARGGVKRGQRSNILISQYLRQLLIFFAEILHAGRAAIDMKQIGRDLSLKASVRVHWVDLGGGAEAKIKLFQIMVMLYIKLKLTTLAATL